MILIPLNESAGRPDIAKIEKAYKEEDKRLSKEKGVKVNGHPFIICTNIARWLKKEFYPTGKIMGFHAEDNPDSEIGQVADGHDFLVVDNRYIIDFWYRDIEDMDDAPVLLDMNTQKELVSRYYGDVNTWTEVK